MNFIGTLLGFLLLIIPIRQEAKRKKRSALNAEKEKSVQAQKSGQDQKKEETAKIGEGTTMAYNTAALIAEALDRNDIRYRMVELDEITFLEAGYGIQGGPTVHFHFITRHDSDKNDVQIRIFGLLNRIGAEKRVAMLEACNRINSEMRFLKFYLDGDSDLLGEADLPSETAEDCVGACCVELFLRGVQILNECYHYIPEAYYRSTAEEKNEKLLNTLNALKELRDHPVTIPAENTDNTK